MVLGLDDDNTGTDSRNVFIFFVAVAAVSYVSFDEAASILSGRIAGHQDDGDRIMANLDARRATMLQALNIESPKEYKKWRNNCIRESRKKRFLQTRPSPDVVREESADRQEQESKKSHTQTERTSHQSSQNAQSKSDREQEVVDMLREASKLLERLAKKMNDKG